MADKTNILEVAEDDQEAFVLCLTLGTLEAMRRGAWPLEAGVWSLGRPAFWRPLAEAGVAEEVVMVLQHADELSALARLGDRTAAERALDRMIDIVRSRLSTCPGKSWNARWSRGSGA